MMNVVNSEAETATTMNRLTVRGGTATQFLPLLAESHCRMNPVVPNAANVISNLVQGLEGANPPQ